MILAGGPMLVRAAKTLDIYFIDVEGGQATLVVTPAGESMLIDAGFPSDDALIAPIYGTKPGASANGRDAKRILAAAKDAGLSQIDYMLVTHFHADHDGGIVEVAEALPMRAFIDHGEPAPGTDDGVPLSMANFERYKGVRAKGRHLEPAPGEVLPLKGVEARVVSADALVLARPLPGAGATNPACVGTGVPAQEKIENPQSLGIRLRFGAFRFLNLGDLSGPPLFALSCPNDLIGRIDVYLVAHHGGADAADPAIFKAIDPLVAVFNNGPRKGAQPAALATVQQLRSTDGWQLHRSLAPDAANAADERLANLDESTSAWIKVSAREDGSFTVTNGRTGYSKSYRR
jgi:beta-lactamase superfamily II metal-dependent hydrolase